MPPHKTLTIESISGTSYEFGVYPLDENPEFPALPGIYIFTKRYLNEHGEYKHNILYIGETHSFEQRLVDSHEKWPCTHNRGANCVCLYYYDDEERGRRIIERALIDKWNPICND